MLSMAQLRVLQPSGQGGEVVDVAVLETSQGGWGGRWLGTELHGQGWGDMRP